MTLTHNKWNQSKKKKKTARLFDWLWGIREQDYKANDNYKFGLVQLAVASRNNCDRLISKYFFNMDIK